MFDKQICVLIDHLCELRLNLLISHCVLDDTSNATFDAVPEIVNNSTRKMNPPIAPLNLLLPASTLSN